MYTKLKTSFAFYCNYVECTRDKLIVELIILFIHIIKLPTYNDWKLKYIDNNGWINLKLIKNSLNKKKAKYKCLIIFLFRESLLAIKPKMFKYNIITYFMSRI